MGFGKDKSTYRTASQVYEAQDAGFTLEETIKLLEKRKEAIGYCLAHRKEIEPKIRAILKQIYPTKKITKPYLTPNLRDYLRNLE